MIVSFSLCMQILTNKITMIAMWICTLYLLHNNYNIITYVEIKQMSINSLPAWIEIHVWPTEDSTTFFYLLLRPMIVVWLYIKLK